MRDIFLLLQASCKDHDYRHAFFQVDSLHAVALNNYLEGRGIVHASTDFPMNLSLRGVINLADIQRIYPLDSLRVSGLLKINLNSSGKYAPEHHLFPKTNAHFSLENGFIQTRYYPHPIEKINIEASASDDRGDMNGLSLSVEPFGLSLENKSFSFQGMMNNFDDLTYDLSVHGELDLGRIYQVFDSRDGTLSGLIRVHAHFKRKNKAR